MSVNWSNALNELVTRGAFPQAIHRLLLTGPAGTGKTSWAGFALGDVERITLHSQMPPEDLIGSLGLVGKAGATETVWHDGPAVRAMRNGMPLVIDEIDQCSPDLRCALHAICDDWSVASITLPTCEVVRPNRGFCVVATTNADPATFPAPLMSRFDLVIHCAAPASGVLDKLPAGWRDILSRSYARQDSAAWTQPVSVRSVLALQRLSRVIPLGEAAELVFGEEQGAELADAFAIAN
jgi:MoxR-like ATPase